MAQYVKKLFDGDRKAVFSFTALIASTTAEHIMLMPQVLTQEMMVHHVHMLILIECGGVLIILL